MNRVQTKSDRANIRNSGKKNQSSLVKSPKYFNNLSPLKMLKNGHHLIKRGLPLFNEIKNRHIHEVVGKIFKARKDSKRGDIPFNFADLFHGIQAPAIRLYFGPTAFNTSNGTQNADVFSLIPTNYLNWTQYAAVFDEYRVIGGVMEYYSGAAANITQAAAGAKQLSLGIGAIDYTDATAFSTLAEAAQLDSKHWVTLYCEPQKSRPTPDAWPVWFEPLPDQEWITTASPLAPAYLKFFIDASNSNATAVAGYVTGWMDFQFRNSD